jgi:predicted transcriptional regulator
MPRKREVDTARFPEYEYIAHNCSERRTELGLSQTNLADRCSGMDQAYVSSVERMQVNPTLEVLSALAKALEWTLSDLVKEPFSNVR